MTARENELFLFGASGHAKVIIDIVERAGRYSVAGLFDDDPKLCSGRFFDYPLLGGRIELLELIRKRAQKAQFLVSIGANEARRAVTEWLSGLPVALADAIHPGAWIGRGVEVGPGTAIMAGAVVNSGSTIGAGTIVNTAASVDHDCSIGQYAHIAPGCTLCGGVTIGDGAFIGAGSVIIPGIRVGMNAIVGAGSTVIREVPDEAIVVGCPARPKRARV